MKGSQRSIFQVCDFGNYMVSGHAMEAATTTTLIRKRRSFRHRPSAFRQHRKRGRCPREVCGAGAIPALLHLHHRHLDGDMASSTSSPSAVQVDAGGATSATSSGTWQITKILIVGVDVGQGIQPVDPVVQWSAFHVEGELGA